MSVKVMLAPNPAGKMSIERVIVVGKTADQQRLIVLDIDALSKDPALMQVYGAEYRRAAAFWNSVGAALFLSGVALSFFWRWWAIIAGVTLAAMVIKATRRSAADIAAKVLASNHGAATKFAEQGLIWESPPQSVVPASVGTYPEHLMMSRLR